MDEKQRTHKKARLKGDELHSQGTSHERRRQESLQRIKNGAVFHLLPEELRDDPEIALAAILKRPWGETCEAVSVRLKNNREFVLTAVKACGVLLQIASEELRNDREIVLEAIRQNSKALRFASEELRGNREIALEAVQKNRRAFQFVARELWADREFVLAVVPKYGLALCYAAVELGADREVVLAAIRRNTWALRFASQELRDDREIILESIRKDARALLYASRGLRGDRVIVFAALNNASGSGHLEAILRCVPSDLQNDPMVAGVIIRKGGRFLQGSEIMERLENVLFAIRALPQAFTQRVVDEASVVELYRQWEHWVWRKIWMAVQLEPPGMPGIGRLLVELSGLPLELRQAKELCNCAPVIGVVASLPGQDWKDLHSYLA